MKNFTAQRAFPMPQRPALLKRHKRLETIQESTIKDVRHIDAIHKVLKKARKQLNGNNKSEHTQAQRQPIAKTNVQTIIIAIENRAIAEARETRKHKSQCKCHVPILVSKP